MTFGGKTEALSRKSRQDSGLACAASECVGPMLSEPGAHERSGLRDLEPLGRHALRIT